MELASSLMFKTWIPWSSATLFRLESLVTIFPLDLFSQFNQF